MRCGVCNRTLVLEVEHHGSEAEKSHIPGLCVPCEKTPKVRIRLTKPNRGIVRAIR